MAVDAIRECGRLVFGSAERTTLDRCELVLVVDSLAYVQVSTARI